MRGTLIGRSDVSDQTSCFEWDREESAGGHADIGTDHILVGTPGWVPGQFGNGLHASGSDEVDYAATAKMFGTKQAISMWVQPSGYNIVSGVTSDGSFHFYWYARNDPAPDDYWIGLTCNNSGLYLQFLLGGTWYYNGVVATTGIDANSGTNHRLALLYDVAGIPGAGGDTLRIYWDGAIVFSTNASLGAAPAGSAGTNPVSLGSLGIDYGYIFNAEAVLDNLKLFEDALTDIPGNMLTEGWPATIPSAPAWILAVCP
jgi:hypothetical protein